VQCVYECRPYDPRSGWACNRGWQSKPQKLNPIVRTTGFDQELFIILHQNGSVLMYLCTWLISWHDCFSWHDCTYSASCWSANLSNSLSGVAGPHIRPKQNQDITAQLLHSCLPSHSVSLLKAGCRCCCLPRPGKAHTGLLARHAETHCRRQRIAKNNA
jgi:hypothetical protein